MSKLKGPLIVNSMGQSISSAKEEAKKLNKELEKDLSFIPEAKIINNDATLSFIAPEEEKFAAEFIKQHLGFEPSKPTRWHMTVKVYVRPQDISTFVTADGETKSIYLPEMVTANDKYVSCVGLVIAMGPECYKGPKWEEHWFRKLMRPIFGQYMDPCIKRPSCKVGDWIVFPRNEGIQVLDRGIPIQIIYDEHCLMVVEDPTYITRS